MSIYSDYWSNPKFSAPEAYGTWEQQKPKQEKLLNNYFFFDKENAWYKVQAANISDAISQLPDDYEYVRCLLYTSPSPRDKRQSRMPSSA